MRLDIADGYTLSAETDAKNKAGRRLPVIRFTYRPALPRALYNMRQADASSRTGDEQLDNVHKFLIAHVVDWDVTEKNLKQGVTKAALEKIPDAILTSMFNIVADWQPSKWEDQEGNSGGE